MEIFKKLLSILTPRERRFAILLLVMITMMALLEMVGVASIFPFISVLTKPELVYNNHWLNSAYMFSKSIGIDTTDQFLFALGLLVFVFLMTSLGIIGLYISKIYNEVKKRPRTIIKKIYNFKDY